MTDDLQDAPDAPEDDQPEPSNDPVPETDPEAEKQSGDAA